MIFFALRKLFHKLTNTFTFRSVNFRCNPRTGNPSIGNPASGTFSISIFPSAPTNKISTSLSKRFKAFAIDNAGKICPPVPPPLTITRFIYNMFKNRLSTTPILQPLPQSYSLLASCPHPPLFLLPLPVLLSFLHVPERYG